MGWLRHAFIPLPRTCMQKGYGARGSGGGRGGGVVQKVVAEVSGNQRPFKKNPGGSCGLKKQGVMSEQLSEITDTRGDLTWLPTTLL